MFTMFMNLRQYVPPLRFASFKKIPAKRVHKDHPMHMCDRRMSIVIHMIHNVKLVHTLVSAPL